MKIIVSLLSVLLFISCAHHRDVRPHESGVHRVQVKDEDTESAMRNALDQANHYCKQSNRSAAIVSEESKYVGDMNEKDYKKTKNIAKAAQGVGGAVWVLGGKSASNVGGLVGLGGTAASTVAGDGYTAEMKFKCI